MCFVSRETINDQKSFERDTMSKKTILKAKNDKLTDEQIAKKKEKFQRKKQRRMARRKEQQ